MPEVELLQAPPPRFPFREAARAEFNHRVVNNLQIVGALLIGSRVPCRHSLAFAGRAGWGRRADRMNVSRSRSPATMWGRVVTVDSGSSS